MTINTFMDNYHLLINLYYLNKLAKKLSTAADSFFHHLYLIKSFVQILAAL